MSESLSAAEYNAGCFEGSSAKEVTSQAPMFTALYETGKFGLEFVCAPTYHGAGVFAAREPAASFLLVWILLSCR